jgi:hypothetical protein
MIIASNVKKSENKFPSETARKGAFEYAVFLNMAKKKKNRRFTRQKSPIAVQGSKNLSFLRTKSD